MKKTKLTYILVSILILIILTAVTGKSYFSASAGEDEGIKNSDSYSDKLLRFHVIANSDSPKDQEIKIEVMEEVLKSIKPQLEEINTIEETKELLRCRLVDIERIAEHKVREKGMEYDVKASLGSFVFPVKTYGLITLPAGQYQALRIEIGEAKGSNWWCILFPPLCFVDITQGIASGKTINDLKKTLTEEELLQLKTIGEPTQIPVEIRFKITEWFKGIGNRLALSLEKTEKSQ